MKAPWRRHASPAAPGRPVGGDAHLDAVARLLADPEAQLVEPPPEIVALQRALRAGLRERAHQAALATALARASHDVRGALAPALLSAERLTGHAEPAVRRTGELVMTSIDRVMDLLRASVDRLRARRPVPAPALVALRPLLEEVVAHFRPTAGSDAAVVPPEPATERPGLSVHLDVADGLAIDADRAAMRAVFVNLVRNAREAGATTVRLTAIVEAAAIRIEIADDGCGVPVSIRDALEEPAPPVQGFSAPPRGGGATTADLGAVGIGLGIAHDFVVAAGGTLRLIRTGPAGAVLAATLPLKPRSIPPSR